MRWIITLMAAIASLLRGYSSYSQERLILHNGYPAAAGQIVLSVQPNASAQVANALTAKGLSLHSKGTWNNAEVWSLAPQMSIREGIQAAKQLNGVLIAEARYVYSGDIIPQDYYYYMQYAIPKLSLPTAWDITTGDPNLIIAAIDSGVDLDHPDFTRPAGGSNIVAGYDFVDNDSDPSDVYGHGTKTAGITCAVGNNQLGVAGVCWTVSLMPVRVLGADNSGFGEQIADGIDYAVANGARVINMSLGKRAYSHVMFRALADAQAAGVVVCCSAGNETKDNDREPKYPASYNLSNIISVASSRDDDRPSSFTNFGQTSVDLAAPGDQIASTAMGGTYGIASGTSFSSPEVAGMCGLLISKYPSISVEELKLRVMEGGAAKGGWRQKTVTGGVADAAGAFAATPIMPGDVIAEEDTNVNMAISPTVSRTLTVSSSGKVRNMVVSVNIAHPSMDELVIDITHNGKVAHLLSRPRTADFGAWPGECTFDSNWLFRGDDTTGDWTLTVTDELSNGYNGQLLSWSMETYMFPSAGGGVAVDTGSLSSAISNCILWGNTGSNGSQVAVLGNSALSVNYSDSEGGNSSPYTYEETGSSLVWGSAHNLAADPSFAVDDPTYHVQSNLTYGRYVPSDQTIGSEQASSDWTDHSATDSVMSVCVDAGDRSSPYGSELEPNGLQINMGAYGNSPQASKSKHWRITGDANGDCRVNVLDLIVIRNLLGQSPTTGSNWRADINQSGTINVLDLIVARNNLGAACAP
ncbi:MAG TPA: S8 family serine peptidase [Planctomycetota bacterium]|nr:S8 family serine peptidase [Planctomycetota bacterium]